MKFVAVILEHCSIFVFFFVPSHKGKEEFHFPSSHLTVEEPLYPELQANLRRVPCPLLGLEVKMRPFEGATGGGQRAQKERQGKIDKDHHQLVKFHYETVHFIINMP